MTSEAKSRRLAALAEELDFRIKHGTLDDVKALLRRGAPVNGIPKQVDVARAWSKQQQLFTIYRRYKYVNYQLCLLLASVIFVRLPTSIAKLVTGVTQLNVCIHVCVSFASGINCFRFAVTRGLSLMNNNNSHS